MEKMLILEQVCYEYNSDNRKVQAVKDVTCSFERGKMYAIVGKSGSGKSTLMSMLAGMKLPTEGHIQYKSQDLSHMDVEVYRQKEIGIIHQAYHLFPRLTVLENVCYPLEMMGMSAKQAKDLAVEKIKAVGLQESQIHSFPFRLSGGEQQRVAIARAIAKGAKVILADEPTGNLDKANTERIMEILRSLVDAGCCVIIVTHDDKVAAYADVCLKMDEGEMVEIEDL